MASGWMAKIQVTVAVIQYHQQVIFNGDGYDDLIIGAYGTGPNGADSGSAYVVFGKASGFSASIDLSALTGSNGFRLDGVNQGDNSGYSVSSAGDVNGDGL